MPKTLQILCVLLMSIPAYSAIISLQDREVNESNPVLLQQLVSKQRALKAKQPQSVSFDEYEAAYPKPGQTASQKKAREITFKENVKQITALNNRPRRTWKAGINQFTGISQPEFQKIYLTLGAGPAVGAQNVDVVSPPSLRSSSTVVLQSRNWVAAGKVTSPKNQGSCGSCWAFSVIGEIQSRQLIKNNQLRDLSEKQVLDCNTKAYSCSGGWMGPVYNDLKSTGVMSQTDYPYPRSKPQKTTCLYDSSKVVTRVQSFTRVSWNKSCTALQREIQSGPISIAVIASGWGSYQQGVFGDSCDSTASVNHAVLAVGWDQPSGNWTIKNSWGTSWGENGYIRLAAGNCRKVCQYIFRSEVQ